MMMMVGPEAGSFPCWLDYAATSGPRLISEVKAQSEALIRGLNVVIR
jgi:hypothetical protein